jgi:uncharacterized membrane protein YkoI
MKLSTKPVILALTLATLFGWSGLAFAESQEKMLADAKVDRTHAEVIALAQARGGRITAAKIERAHGHLVWAFAITTSSATTTQVLVDAQTGKIVPTQEGEEAKANQKKQE